jgi:hypothetical protein
MQVPSKDDYATMVTTEVKSKSPHIVTIMVEELQADDNANKENKSDDGDEDQAGKKGNKKVCICRYLSTALV